MPKRKKKNEKNSFIISPIGKEDSPERKRSNQILKFVIDPIVTKLGYKSIRADKISKPGIITSQIIDHLLNDSLVIADLTGHNPNVFYELAVRHTVKKPVIQIIQKGERIPFDIATNRTIQVDYKDLESVDCAKKELKRQIESVEKDPSLVDSPISMAVDLTLLRQSSDPEGKTIADLTKMMHEIAHVVTTIQVNTAPSNEIRLDQLSKALYYSDLKIAKLEEELSEYKTVKCDSIGHLINFGCKDGDYWCVEDSEGNSIRFENEKEAREYYKSIQQKKEERDD